MPLLNRTTPTKAIAIKEEVALVKGDEQEEYALVKVTNKHRFISLV